MTIPIRIISPRIKKLHNRYERSMVPVYDNEEYDNFFIENKAGNPDTDESFFQKTLTDLQKQYHLQQFSEWRMPEQATGYIKASKHNLL